MFLTIGQSFVAWGISAMQAKMAADAAKAAEIAKIKADYAAAMQALANLKGGGK
jgi:anti-sigma factor RsiW